MRPHRVTRALSSAAACAFALGAFSLQAAAQQGAECEADADCERGFHCASYDSVCPAIACADEDPECEIKCEPSTQKACEFNSECEADTDCPEDYLCAMRTSEMCSGGGSAGCPDDGSECEPSTPIEPECTEVTEKTCVPPWAVVCEDDSSCIDGFVCVTHTSKSCTGSSGVACPDNNEDCKPIEPVETCEEYTEKLCGPRWLNECEQNEDCGRGFECVERVETACGAIAGGAGAVPTPSGDGDFAADPIPDAGAPAESEPECTSEPTGIYYCELVVVECASDDDCDDGLRCESNLNRPVCDTADARPAIGASDPGAAPDQDAGAANDDGADDGSSAEDLPATDCGSDEPEKICTPPYYNDIGGAGVGIERDAVLENGASTTGEGGEGQNAGGAEPPTVDDDAADPSATADGNAAKGDSTGDAADDDEDGCRAGGRGNASHVTWLVLAALTLLRRRRALAR